VDRRSILLALLTEYAIGSLLTSVPGALSTRRMNPCTLGWYLPLLVKDVPGALQPSDDGDRPSSGSGAHAFPAGRASRDEPHGHTKARGTLRTQDGASPSTVTATTALRASSGAGVSPVLHGGASASGNANTNANAGAFSTSGSAPRGPLEPGLGAGTWKDLDAKFRRDLPDEAYVGRLAYRGLVMRACPAIRLLDGVEVSVKEKEKAERVLKSVLEAARTGSGTGTGAKDAGAQS